MCGLIAALGMDVESHLPFLKHRGVRSNMVKTSCGSVGHVRLPIVGLGEEYDQPITADQFTVAFVGELLDFREKSPNEECDVDTVVGTWLVEGPRGFVDHDGFWSIVALDSRTEELHVLCDYLAQKPTYYRTDMPIVASELDPLAAAAPVSPDEVYLAAVVKWGYCPETQRTPYDQVKRVLPGEHVVLREQLPPECTVVDPLLPVFNGDLKDEIHRAVRRRVLSSDVPVAVLVSGGLDSSIVYHLARQAGRVKAYYACDGAQDDLVEKLAVSAIVGSDPVEQIHWDDVPLIRALKYMQEPVDLGSLIPQVALSDQIEERVCLTGDGADEFFGGYGRAARYDSQASDVWHELVAWHLPRLDRVMMRNRVEVRSPFLARRVAGIALTLSWEQRKDKKILRDLFRDDLPPLVADQPKRPLRTRKVEVDREENSRVMVEVFRRLVWQHSALSASPAA